MEEAMTPVEIAEFIFKAYDQSKSKGKQMYNYFLSQSIDPVSRQAVTDIHNDCLVIMRAKGMRV